MKIRDPFGELEQLRKRIGGREHSNSFNIDSGLKGFQQQLEISEKKVKNVADLQQVGPYLTYKGEILVILYIFNSSATSLNLKDNSPSSAATPKFHFAWCSTLDNMQRKDRIERYVISRSKSNRFRIEARELGKRGAGEYGRRHILENIRLYPCQNCLSELRYHGFGSHLDKALRFKQVEEFSIEEFLKEHDGNLVKMKQMPKRYEESAGPVDYTSDWSEISDKFREENDWRCSKCGVCMRDMPKGLHTHHINGIKSNNNLANLQALCALCHKEVHPGMRVDPEVECFITKNRAY
ncbi:MAG: HNH endonuclease [Gammaproteobacteria bacterium AqS3]|nr:HNH endonuclease [Gammaproteobacteria bacterium AqS3]